MIEIRAAHDAYYIIVGDEVLELSEDRVIRRGDWKEPLKYELERGETWGRLVGKLSFLKMGDKITDPKDFESLPDGSKISDGRTLLKKERGAWYDTLFTNTIHEYHPRGEWMVVINAGPLG